MHTLYELKDMLCEELEEFGKKGELTAGSLETVDKLAHAIKNLDKIIEAKEDEEYSNAMMNDGMGGTYARRGGSYARGGRSYARGRGANARRDSMGRYSSERGYSRNEEMIAELHELMNDAQDERTKQEFQRFIQKIEMM